MINRVFHIINSIYYTPLFFRKFILKLMKKTFNLSRVEYLYIKSNLDNSREMIDSFVDFSKNGT